jgi:type VI secretion system protein ImpA
MASVPTLDIEAILKPISAEKPAGSDVREAKSFTILKEARREEEALVQGDWKRDIKAADWPKVVQTATKILTTESKDLQVTVWLIEGVVKRNGFAGLRDGLKVLRGLHEQYWDSMYPLVEDGDVEFRSGKIEALTQKLPVALKMVPIIKPQGGTHYSYSAYEESRQVENLRRGGAPTQDALAEALAEGKVDGEKFDKAVAGVPLNHCSNLLEDLVQAQEELERFNHTLDEQYKDAAPSLSQIGQVVGDCLTLIDGIVRKKGGVGLQRPAQEGTSEEQQEFTVTPSTAGTGGGIMPHDRHDAIRRLSAIANFFRQTEPHSPVSYLVQRAARWGEMPLEEWLQEVIKNEGVLGEVKETLGLMMKQPDTQQNG